MQLILPTILKAHDFIGQAFLTLNPFVPFFFFWGGGGWAAGHRQTVQTQIRRRRTRRRKNAAWDQGLHYLLTGISIGNKMKTKKYTRHPYIWKWARPIDKDGKVHWANKD